MRKEKIAVQINEDFRIVKSGHGIVLIERFLGKDKDGNEKYKEGESFYGCLYQALQGFLKKTVDRSGSIDEIKEKVKSSLSDIRDAEYQIKETFSAIIRKE